jgi:tetratricopeptide (TPR) repeat protein
MVTANVDNSATILKYQLEVASARRGDDSLKLAHRVRHLGDAYYYAGRLELAEPCYVEALAIYRSHESPKPLDLANAIRSFAVLKHEVGAIEEAQKLWQEAHDMYATLNILAGVAGSAGRLALIAQHEGNLERSREWLSEAISAADASADPETLAYIRKVTAQLNPSRK